MKDMITSFGILQNKTLTHCNCVFLNYTIVISNHQVRRHHVNRYAFKLGGPQKGNSVCMFMEESKFFTV